MKFTPGCCCTPSCGQICVKTIDACTGGPLDGATVTLTGPGSIGNNPCTTDGRVASITVTSGGLYSSAPAVSMPGTATATAVLATSSAVNALNLTNGGSGYTTAPIVSFSPSGAAATAQLTAGPVVSLTLTSGGSGYTTATVTLAGGGGTGATATATVVGGVVTAINLTNGGAGYTSAPQVTISGSFFPAHATAGLAAGPVVGLTLTSGGSYSSPPTVSFSGGGGGSGAAATATLADKPIASFTITNEGSGYASPPPVTISTMTGSGGAGTAVLVDKCCPTISQAGTFTATATKPLYTTASATTTLGTCAGSTLSLVLTPLPTTLTMGALSSCAPNYWYPGGVPTAESQNIPFATLSGTLEGGAASCTTDAAGNACVLGTVHYGSSYAITATAPPRYATTTGTIVGPACNNPTGYITMAPASGYECLPGYSCRDPIALTLHLTDPIWGLLALTGTAGSAQRSGSMSVTVPAQCGCPSRSCLLTYTIEKPGAYGLTLEWTATAPTFGLQYCPGGPATLAVYLEATTVTCPSTGAFMAQFVLPAGCPNAPWAAGGTFTLTE